jgi:hypothetical protein
LGAYAYLGRGNRAGRAKRLKYATRSAAMILSSADGCVRPVHNPLKNNLIELGLADALKHVKGVQKFMRQQWKFVFLSMFVGGAAWFAPAARADEWNKETVLTFSAPVEIPDQVLPAGTYVFKLFDSQSGRGIVQVYTEDQTHLLATVMAVPVDRLEPADKTVVTFEERASGAPEALHTWFYPGETTGVEFVYRKSQMNPAAQAGQPAAAAGAPSPQTTSEQPPAQQAAVEQPEEESQSPAIVHEREVIAAQLTSGASEDNSSPAQNENPVADTLPQTAGNFASIPLLGLALLVGGFGALRFATRQS